MVSGSSGGGVRIVNIGESGRGLGNGAVAVTGVTGDLLLSAEVLPIKSVHHENHLTGHVLHVIVFGVGCPVGFRLMAKFAAFAQRPAEKTHRGQELVFGNSAEYLNILINILGHQFFLWRSLAEPARSPARVPASRPKSRRLSWRSVFSVSIRRSFVGLPL